MPNDPAYDRKLNDIVDTLMTDAATMSGTDAQMAVSALLIAGGRAAGLSGAPLGIIIELIVRQYDIGTDMGGNEPSETEETKPTSSN